AARWSKDNIALMQDLRSMAEGQRRILVLEDDRETAQQLVDSLSNSGYQVDLAVDGEDGLRRGRSNEYAVMTIDRKLPLLGGLSVPRRLREDGIVTPALILSALGGTDDRVHGLRAGGPHKTVCLCRTAGPRRGPGPPQRDGGQGNGPPGRRPHARPRIAHGEPLQAQNRAAAARITSCRISGPQCPPRGVPRHASAACLQADFLAHHHH